MKRKLWIHLITLPRHFALPFFLGTMLIGVVLAGGELLSLNTVLALLVVFFLASGGHSFNTWCDTCWLKLDEPNQSHSVEKGYTAGSIVITEGWASAKEVLANALVWYALALIPGIWLAIIVTPWILLPLFYGMSVTFMYSPSKFTYAHELVLASGPIATAIIGALSTGTGEWLNALLVSIPIVLIFSYAGLALDEAPDWEANVKKGVKSLAFKVGEYGYDLSLYIMLWVFLAFLVQMFFITIDILKPLTALTLIILPLAISASVFLKKEQTFKKAALVIVFVAMWYPLLLLFGEVFG